MHNGKAIWDGTADAALATVTTVVWEVDFANSPTQEMNAGFDIAKGDNAVVVARKLSAKWNSQKGVEYPTMPEGVAVVFGSTKPDNEIVGMRFKVNDDKPVRVRADGTEVKVVEGLFVHRSA